MIINYCITFKKVLFFDDKPFMIIKKKIKTHKLMQNNNFNIVVCRGIKWYMDMILNQKLIILV